MRSKDLMHSVILEVKGKGKINPATFCQFRYNSLDTGVGSLSLLQGIFPTQGWNPGLLHCGGFFTSQATREAQEYWSG